MTDSRAPRLLPTDNARDLSDPKQVKDAENIASLRDTRLRLIEQSVMATQAGREWVWSVLTDLDTFSPKVITGEAAFANGYASGQRDAGLSLMRRLAKSAPVDFGRMLTEQDNG